ncbi:MAG: hypothetical protein M0P64_02945 [Candidatus Pacebacteria bacterium]|jgi:hypothetical protein|nr:hypothetical protein [Candidatus Paceibacterota bacterium]
MQVKTIPIIFFTWTITTCCFAEQIAEYIRIPSKGPGFAIDRTTNSVIVGDVGYDAKFCDAENEFHCVVSKVFEFAVPRNSILQNKWEFNGSIYKVIQRIRLRGERPALVIEKNGSPKIWYLWSTHRGLMMFDIKTREKQAGGLLLDGVCGFAASNGCIEN